MIRQIKFRAWDKERKEWLFNGDAMDLQYSGESGAMMFDNDANMTPRDYLEWDQFTGLQDKNGKDIYEGDIVAADSDKEARTVEVIFKDGCFYGEYKPHQFCERLHRLFSIWGDMNANYTVIGNVWESPEDK